jgi:hypothetical protein
MSCLAWNCRGLGNPQTVHELSIMVRKKDPIVLFLSVTKLDENRLEVLRCHWRFGGKFVVPSRGQSGGLVMFWSGHMGVSISSYSQYHIDAVLDYQSTNAWRFTGFYGSPTVEGKSAAWSILRTLRTHHNLPWLCAGDFNELLSNSEKWGRRPRPEHQMSQFRRVVDDCGFLDLGFTGPSFTWCNNQTGDSQVLERLDRSFATMDWLLRFPNCRVHHMHVVFSDHSPLWMELNPPVRTPRSRRKQFQFEEMWTMDPRCEEMI